MRPLIDRCLDEHAALIKLAGAGDLLRKTGWIEVYLSSETMAAGLADVTRLRAYGLRIDTLDAAALKAREPNISGVYCALHYLDPASVADPRLCQAYADLFVSRGANARDLQEARDGRWSVALGGFPAQPPTAAVICVLRLRLGLSCATRLAQRFPALRDLAHNAAIGRLRALVLAATERSCWSATLPSRASSHPSALCSAICSRPCRSARRGARLGDNLSFARAGAARSGAIVAIRSPKVR